MHSPLRYDPLTMLRTFLAALPFAVVLAVGCRPAAVVSPNGGTALDSANKIVAALGEGGVACETTKEKFVHCNVEGVDLVIGVTLAPTGTQLTLMLPFHQPACSAAGYHEKLAKFNADYFMVVAACVDAKTLIIAHRSHLFRSGLDKKDLQDVVRRWMEVAFSTATHEGLLAPAGSEGAPATPDEHDSPSAPKKPKKKGDPDEGGGKI